VNGNYSFSIEQMGGIEEISFKPMIREIIAHLKDRRDTGMISAMFHNTIAYAAAETCVKIRCNEGINKVVFSGGVFQNDLLLNLIEKELHARNFETYSHSYVPPNDGGISLGQAAVAVARSRNGMI
jgi:hydrogenase maturation protein HypF